MDASSGWKGSGKNWVIVGMGLLAMSGLFGLVSHASRPPASLMTATGTVVSVDKRSPSRSPKFNIFIDDGHDVLRVYTDLGMIRSTVGVGDVVQASFEKDPFDRNFHRAWDLRRGNEVLLSKENLFPEANAEASQIERVALFGAVISAAVIAVGAFLQARFRATHRKLG